jgi:hypothetical protein
MDPFADQRDKPLPHEDETLYYYRKPDSQPGDPCCIINGKNVHLICGEVFIGIYEQPEDPEIVIQEVNKFFTEDMKQIFKIQREYFGEEVFSHIKNSSIKLMLSWQSYLIENNVELIEKLSNAINDDIWPCDL